MFKVGDLISHCFWQLLGILAVRISSRNVQPIFGSRAVIHMRVKIQPLNQEILSLGFNLPKSCCLISGPRQDRSLLGRIIPCP